MPRLDLVGVPRLPGVPRPTRPGRGARAQVRAWRSLRSRSSQMLAGDSIPPLSVGLFNSAGEPCCGEDQVAVRLRVSKGDTEYDLTGGFADRDSDAGPAGSRMMVEFFNLRLADQMAVGAFNVTVSALYLNFPVEYTVLRRRCGPSLLPARCCAGARLTGRSDRSN